MSKVVITGATGFIGAKLTADLAQAHQVVALTRHPVPAENGSGVQWHQVEEIGDVGALAAILENADVVIHLADSPGRHAAASDHAPAQAASALVQAMADANVQRVIFASSIYARLASQTGDNAYGQSKFRSEQVFLTEAGILPIILRLPPVYGPGSRGGFATLVKLISRGLPVPLGKATAPRAYLSLANLSGLISRLVEMPAERWKVGQDRIYEPSDGKDVSTADLTNFIAHMLLKQTLNLGIPLSVLSLLGRLTGKAEAVHGAINPLKTCATPDIGMLCGWTPVEQMPESLNFLKEG